jgi:hypothetical protein
MNLPAGNYTVTTNVGTGYTQTYDLDGISSRNRATASLAPGQNRLDVDFGYVLPVVVIIPPSSGGGGGSSYIAPTASPIVSTVVTPPVPPSGTTIVKKPIKKSPPIIIEKAPAI